MATATCHSLPRRHECSGHVVTRDRDAGHMSQLDGLRCFAVLGVLVSHAWGPDRPGFLRWIDWGHAGVWLFFVLSGFLITGILLDGRENRGRQRLFYLR